MEKEWGILILVAGMAFFLALSWGRWRRSRLSSRRARHGLAEEKAAMTVLARQGYRIDGVQEEKSIRFFVDGEEQFRKVRVDYLVSKGGRTYVAEVKTGQAFDMGNSATRRQLVEYQLVFQPDGLLLVDGDRQEIHEIRFDHGYQESFLGFRWALRGLAGGIFLGYLLARWL